MGRSTLLCSMVNITAVLSVICRARAKRSPSALTCLLSDIAEILAETDCGRHHAVRGLGQYGRTVPGWEGNYSFGQFHRFWGVFTWGSTKKRRPLQSRAGVFIINGS